LTALTPRSSLIGAFWALQHSVAAPTAVLHLLRARAVA
jgi:hypothetical protein